jgi:hypothetical protein
MTETALASPKAPPGSHITTVLDRLLASDRPFAYCACLAVFVADSTDDVQAMLNYHDCPEVHAAKNDTRRWPSIITAHPIAVAVSAVVIVVAAVGLFTGLIHF